MGLDTEEFGKAYCTILPLFSKSRSVTLFTAWIVSTRMGCNVSLDSMFIRTASNSVIKFSLADTMADALAAPEPLLGMCELDVRCCCDPVRVGTASIVAGRPIFSLSVAFGTSNWNQW